MKNIISLSLIITLFISCRKQRDEPQPTKGIIEGTVFLSGTNSTIEGVKVELDGLQKITNNLGTFSFEDITEGSYTLEASHPKYHFLTIETKIIAGKTVDIDLDLVLLESLLEVSSDSFLIYGDDTTNILFLDSSQTQSNFEIINRGGKALNWRVSSNKDWVSFNEINGTDDFTILLEVDKTKISTGCDTAIISVTNIEAGSEYIQLFVKKQLPELAIKSDHFSHDSIIDFGLSTTTELSFDIYNAGGNYNMPWRLSKDKDWLLFDGNDSGTNDQTVNLSIDRSFVTIEYDTATINITNTETNVTKRILVAMEKEIPVLDITSDDFEFSQDTSINFGLTSTSKNFSINNIGRGVLNWQIINTVDWLHINHESGSGTEDIVLTIDREKIITSSGSTTVKVRNTDYEDEKTIHLSFLQEFDSDIIEGNLSFAEALENLHSTSPQGAIINDIHFTNNYFYVASDEGSKIMQYDHDYNHLQTFNQSFSGVAYSVKNIGDNLYYSDNTNNTIYKISNETTLNASPFITLPGPKGMCLDQESNIWVCYGNASIRKFNDNNTELLDFTISDLTTSGNIKDVEIINKRIYILDEQHIHEVSTMGEILNSISLPTSASTYKFLTSDESRYLYVSKNHIKGEITGEVLKIDKNLNGQNYIISKTITDYSAIPHGYSGLTFYNNKLYVIQEGYGILESYE